MSTAADLRRYIRKYVVSVLKGKTDAEDSVFDTRLKQITLDERLPVINVLTYKDKVEEVFSVAPYAAKTSVDLTIEIFQETYTDREDDEEDRIGASIDSVCAQVEKLIDYHLGDRTIIEKCTYESTELKLSLEGNRPLAMAAINYNVVGIIEEQGMKDPSLLNEFKKLNMDWDMADPNKTSGTENYTLGPDGQIDAKDIVELSQV